MGEGIGMRRSVVVVVECLVLVCRLLPVPVQDVAYVQH